MIGRTEYHNVSGTRCATDFVELPSILMEHFLSSPDVLRSFALHHQTGRALPLDIIKSLFVGRQRFSALETSTQITMAAADQAYHSQAPLERSFDSTRVWRETMAQYHVVGAAEGTMWQTQFGHLFGYGATYYSYLFDRAIAARIFATEFSGDPMNRDAGEAFKKGVLQWGGGKDPWEMVGQVVKSDVVAKGGRDAMEEVGKWGIEDYQV
jgi:intermediate peptidase